MSKGAWGNAGSRLPGPGDRDRQRDGDPEADLARQLDYLFSRSLFYQDKFGIAGVRRKDYRKLRDLARFPGQLVRRFAQRVASGGLKTGGLN
jgi:hypothetical protein